MNRRRTKRKARQRDNRMLLEAEARIKVLTREIESLRSALGEAENKRPQRNRLPDTRQSITHKFSIAGHEGYITVGLFADGSPGEIFVRMAKMGSSIRGFVDTIAILTSLALQYGVPVDDLAWKFRNTRFEPSGYTTNPEINVASSIPDYIFTWLSRTFVSS